MGAPDASFKCSGINEVWCPNQMPPILCVVLFVELCIVAISQALSCEHSIFVAPSSLLWEQAFDAVWCIWQTAKLF